MGATNPQLAAVVDDLAELPDLKRKLPEEAPNAQIKNAGSPKTRRIAKFNVGTPKLTESISHPVHDEHDIIKLVNDDDLIDNDEMLALPMQLIAADPNTIALFELARTIRQMELLFKSLESDSITIPNHLATKLEFTHVAGLRPCNFYSSPCMAALAASVSVPAHWLIEMEDEHPFKQSPRPETTDIAYVAFHQNLEQWAVIHLAITSWEITYYDGFDAATDIEGLVQTVIERWKCKCRKFGRDYPESDPAICLRTLILQDDCHSCGPIAFSRIETLMGVDVSIDFVDPDIIRARHAKMVLATMRRCIACWDPIKVPVPTTIASEIKSPHNGYEKIQNPHSSHEASNSSGSRVGHVESGSGGADTPSIGPEATRMTCVKCNLSKVNTEFTWSLHDGRRLFECKPCVAARKAKIGEFKDDIAGEGWRVCGRCSCAFDEQHFQGRRVCPTCREKESQRYQPIPRGNWTNHNAYRSDPRKKKVGERCSRCTNFSNRRDPNGLVVCKACIDRQKAIDESRVLLPFDIPHGKYADCLASTLAMYVQSRCLGRFKLSNRDEWIAALEEYDQRLETRLQEQALMKRITVIICDLLIVISRESSGSEKPKKPKDPKDPQESEQSVFEVRAKSSIDHFITRYSNGIRPGQILSGLLVQSAIRSMFRTQRRPLRNTTGTSLLYDMEQAMNMQKVGSQVTLLLHGRDGLYVDMTHWEELQDKFPHLTFWIAISDYFDRVCTEVLTGWEHGPEDTLWQIFSLRELIAIWKGTAGTTNPACDRLLEKWGMQRDRRVTHVAAHKMEGGKAIGRNKRRGFVKK